ncbi:hypothetical protein STCU_10581 [Strigomonas culicis]|uniref:Uncharacterized protein n=1 Tax=Strigomonas culicis TaxID=28005 RepID=S9V3S3_9TRYP|nr:hypothetical protein STCU_10581 [Strigomonas culicis]|eukprot:EPY17505.1 hypothetical protein STCU_10581 [Strigomonas culicis]
MHSNGDAGEEEVVAFNADTDSLSFHFSDADDDAASVATPEEPQEQPTEEADAGDTPPPELPQAPAVAAREMALDAETPSEESSPRTPQDNNSINKDRVNDEAELEEAAGAADDGLVLTSAEDEPGVLESHSQENSSDNNNNHHHHNMSDSVRDSTDRANDAEAEAGNDSSSSTTKPKLKKRVSFNLDRQEEEPATPPQEPATPPAQPADATTAHPSTETPPPTTPTAAADTSAVASAAALSPDTATGLWDKLNKLDALLLHKFPDLFERGSGPDGYPTAVRRRSPSPSEAARVSPSPAATAGGVQDDDGAPAGASLRDKYAHLLPSASLLSSAALAAYLRQQAAATAAIHQLQEGHRYRQPRFTASAPESPGRLSVEPSAVNSPSPMPHIPTIDAVTDNNNTEWYTANKNDAGDWF